MLIYWLVVLPLVVWRGLYEGPKVIWFFLGGIGLCLFWLRRWLKNPEKLALSRADFFYWGWLLTLLLASLLGIHPWQSILGGSYRHQGVLFFFGLWLVVKSLEILSPKQKATLKKIFTWAVLLEAAIVIFQKLVGQVYFGRPLGTLGEPNAVAGFLAIGSIFLLSERRIFLPLIFVAILLTGSKIGLFAFLLTLSPLVTYQSWRKIAFAFLLITALFIGYHELGQKAAILRAPKTQLWQVGQEERILIWRLALDQIRQRPLLGWGAESGEAAFAAAYQEAEMPLAELMVDRAHNLFLDLTLWSGLIGVIFFSFWLAAVWQRALAPWLAFAFFQPLGVVHWLTVVLLFSLWQPKRQPS